MAGNFDVDPEMIQAVAREAGTRAQNMITLVKDMNTQIDFVRLRWEGSTGNEFRTTLDQADLQMDGLITKLQSVSDEINQVGLAFAGQEDSSSTQMAATQAQNSIPSTINFA
jgi:WXG100 family type VII secretion target